MSVRVGERWCPLLLLTMSVLLTVESNIRVVGKIFGTGVSDGVLACREALESL